MNTVMILKNAGHEGPGTLGQYLASRGIGFRIYEPEETASLSDIGSETYALVVLGGPMAVYEMDSHPPLLGSARVMEKALKAGIKVLGVCLGAQLMAHLLGARVYKGMHKEIGWMDIELTEEGAADPVMSGLLDAESRAGAEKSAPASSGARVNVFQWHGDTFDLPSGSVRLARSGWYDNQAFRYGKAAYALQFHIEADNSLIQGWATEDKGAELAYNGPRVDAGYGAYLARAGRFYDRFFGRALRIYT